MEKILITGASGFFGSNLARRLLSEGFEVHILTRPHSNRWRIADIYQDITDWKCDLVDETHLQKIVKEISPQHIIHSATYGGRYYEEDDSLILMTNLGGLVNLIKACQSIDYTTFINTGSSSEYGLKHLPMKEDDSCNPLNMYGISKLSGTLYSQYVANKWNKNIGTIRLFSPFGDFEDKGRLFPDLILNAIENKPIYLTNPDAVRDFIYVHDAIDLYVQIIKTKSQIKGEIYNCGSGKQHSVKEGVSKVLEVTNSKSDVIIESKRHQEIEINSWVCDLTKTESSFQWTPHYDFDQGIKEACQWFERHKNLYKGGDQ
ncbi:NAD-dependent epimerase/dehydratase family protein [Turicibacter sanguinis]|uniref:NAD-dependent epimerase/dehydratase family protein n=1 Tax=Turicibacter sanguinis TaxID=154288 RepID=UPI0018AA1D41|nr:NAD-dependent epimerase/dehydratase family protein [Turicibacter sanguinis]MDB8566198.1 NAD-dependent epimerase/dehydratase family protein [Turicibacter sanguinis]MDB8568938.1 NAD-dependent epimerase/dehydratase family protein [Turicibacter sanguinis]MDB8571699.1 NAD-dependent epimerase/dehydratase family protein [Turicibacter sanguinis]MDB8580447.1 NAD-dependent epimerase/dehydratase family protein [Turicibacter sanguinis]